MPTLTRWFVKSSFVYLVLGLVIGVWQQVPEAALPGLFPIYLHLLTFGWLTQLIFGIAFWMFPKHSAEHPRGYEWLGWTAFTCMNLGLFLRAVFEPLHSGSPSTLGGWMLVAAAVLQWAAGLAFLANSWPRVKVK
ncbi:MAG: hypothetical protein ACOY0R_13500 [Chloroflexota bacterium]|jgi:hypothetical protein